MSSLVQFREKTRPTVRPETPEIAATTPSPRTAHRQSGLFPVPSVKSSRQTREYLDHLKATAASPERRRAAFLRMKAVFDAKRKTTRTNGR